MSLLNTVPQAVLSITVGLIIGLSISMSRLFSKNHFEVVGKTVVITGGSDGTGRSAAIQLAQKGANVIIVARNKNKLEEACERLKENAMNERQRFSWISADLTNSDECERVLREVTTLNNGNAPDIVWCCAGLCLPGFFVDCPPETLKAQMDTVYWTAAFMAHATLRRWLSPGAVKETSGSSPRHLIFTASTLAFVPVAGYGPYSPAKAALRSLADTLNQEIKMYNGSRRNRQNLAPQADVKMHIVFPMGILSAGFENEQKMKPALTKLLEEADQPQTPDEVARKSIKGLEKGEYMITTMLVGTLMKASALGSSVRNSIFVDTILSWISNLAFLAVVWDLDGKTWHWGKKNGISVREN